jgi:hypothetical protein
MSTFERMLTEEEYRQLDYARRELSQDGQVYVPAWLALVLLRDPDIDMDGTVDNRLIRIIKVPAGV